MFGNGGNDPRVRLGRVLVDEGEGVAVHQERYNHLVGQASLRDEQSQPREGEAGNVK